MVELTTWLTQCPECGTKFWVKDEQLQAARGSVRCGSCQSVFKATEYLVSSQSELSENAPSDGAKKTEKIKPFQKKKPAKPSNKKKEISTEKKVNIDARLNKLSKNSTAEKPAKKRHWLFWGMFDLLAVAALASQYIYFNFDDLSQQDEWYPVLNAVCAPIGCQLKSPPLAVAIVTDQLVVRSAPLHKNVLAVDAVIRNQAPSAIPYPLVELRFMDKRNNTVASRVFKPEEYLSGEMKQVRLMQPDQPTHFGLHVVDPGEHAVNYALQFHPNDS